MFASTNFNTAIASALSQLRAAEQALQSITCPQIDDSLRINLSDLSEEQIGELLDGVPTGYGKSDKGIDYVYIIQIQDGSPNLLTTLKEQLAEARKTSNDYPRLNSANAETNTLYVGRSRTLRARLKQHLSAESRGIYSLHLQRWATGNDAEITVFIMKFNGAEDMLVQAVEDGLWASLKPAFGRKGER